jgi:hypothetical protein
MKINITLTPAERTMIVAALMYYRGPDRTLVIEYDGVTALANRLAQYDPADDGPEVYAIRHLRALNELA